MAGSLTREGFMSVYSRAVAGAEAGAFAAVSLEVSFFLLDAVRLTPLATPLALSGAVPSPGEFFVDLTSVSGGLAALWMVYQVLKLTALHLVAFGSLGVFLALFFDWSQPLRLGRMAAVTLLCIMAFYFTAAVSGPVVALDVIGLPLVIGMNLLGAMILMGCLRLVSSPGAVAQSAS
jgi:hypothetical protein